MRSRGKALLVITTTRDNELEKNRVWNNVVPSWFGAKWSRPRRPPGKRLWPRPRTPEYWFGWPWFAYHLTAYYAYRTLDKCTLYPPKDKMVNHSRSWTDLTEKKYLYFSHSEDRTRRFNHVVNNFQQWMTGFESFAVFQPLVSVMPRHSPTDRRLGKTS